MAKTDVDGVPGVRVRTFFGEASAPTFMGGKIATHCRSC